MKLILQQIGTGLKYFQTSMSIQKMGFSFSLKPYLDLLGAAASVASLARPATPHIWRQISNKSWLWITVSFFQHIDTTKNKVNKVEVENVVFNIRRSRFPLQWRQLPVTSSAKPAAGPRHTSRHTDLQAYTVYYTHRHKHVQRKRFIETDAGYIIHHNFRYS